MRAAMMTKRSFFTGSAEEVYDGDEEDEGEHGEGGYVYLEAGDGGAEDVEGGAAVCGCVGECEDGYGGGGVGFGEEVGG